MKTYILILIAYCNCIISAAQINERAASDWIKINDYEISPEINLSDISEGSQLLLYDNQINTTTEEIYHKFAVKITENVGIQNTSDIRVDYDPTYQNLSFHNISVIRDKVIINKLNISHFQVIRREVNAENFIYDGSLSAILNLSDIRVGDIIEYSYTIKGFNPVHNGNFSGYFALNDIEPIGKIIMRLVTDKKLNFKYFNTSIKPKISKLGHHTAYTWQNLNTNSVSIESGTPSWKLLYSFIFFSEYNNWESVADWGVNVFKINDALSNELDQKIQHIAKKHKTEGEKIEATLNFVQNDIRYLGLESGIGSYKPHSFNTVFNQRFGDCKDKSLLFSKMLNEMEIEAYPMLVSTSLKQTLQELVPSPKFFDHCVVKVIDNSGSHFWYDPTLSNQGGTYKNRYFPDYKYGLVLKPETTSLDTITSSLNNIVEVVDNYILEDIGKGATLSVKTTYYEGEADFMRNYYKNNSLSSIKKNYINYYFNQYKSINSIEDPKFEDNHTDNIFTVYEKYRIDSLWQPFPGNKNNIVITLSPRNLLDLLHYPNEHHRKTELGLPYPAIRRHIINVTFPEPWNIVNDNKIISTNAFYYDWSSAYNKTDKKLTLNYYLKMQDDYVPVEDYNTYLDDLKKLENNILYHIYAPKSDIDTYTDKMFDTTSFKSIFVIISVWLIAILGLAFFLYKVLKR